MLHVVSVGVTICCHCRYVRAPNSVQFPSDSRASRRTLLYVRCVTEGGPAYFVRRNRRSPNAERCQGKCQEARQLCLEDCSLQR